MVEFDGSAAAQWFDEDAYHVMHGGLQYGPFRLGELQHRALTADMLAWKPGMPTWQPIEHLPELAELVRPAAGVALSIPPALPSSIPPELPGASPADVPQQSSATKTLAAINGLAGLYGIVCQAPAQVAWASSGWLQRILPTPLAEVFERPVWLSLWFVLIGIDVILCGILIASGIGLWRQRVWGKALAVVWAMLAIVMRASTTGLFAAIVLPALHDWAKTGPPGAWGGFWGCVGGVAGSVAVGSIYPVVLMGLLQRPSLNQALR